MSIKIKPLRKFTTGTPSTSDMVEGELAVNTADKKIFMRDDSNNIVEVANADSTIAADNITTGDAAVNIATSSGNITIDAQGSDTDIIFKGTDDTTDVTFLTMDGSGSSTTFGTTVVFDPVGGSSQFAAMINDNTAFFYRDVKIVNSNSDLIFDKGTYETTLTTINPASQNQTITLPDITGTVLTTGNPEIDGAYGSSSAPRIFKVTVASQTTAHPYYNDGSTNKYSIDGIEGAALTLHGADAVTSNTEYYYRFDQSDGSNSNHPLRFYLDAAKNTQYTTGVTTNGVPGQSGAYTQIAVTSSTPKILYYQCTQHAYMGNYVIVASAGGSVAADDITAGDAAVNLTTTTGNITIDAQGSDTDIIFKGTDNTTDITALTLDMSDGGKAIFGGQASFAKELLVDMAHIGTYTKPAQFLVNDLGVGDRAQFTFGKELSNSNLVEFGYYHAGNGSADNLVSIGFYGSGATGRTVQRPDGRISFGSGDTGTAFFNEVVNVNGGIWLNGSIVFEGSSEDAFETTLAVTNPTGSDKTITLPNATGTVITTGNSDTPTTTTSSGDADFVLIDDGGTMKKITPNNLGIGATGTTAADDITAGNAAVNLTTTSGNITIDAQGNDTDIIFKGTDGNTDVTFLTFDGSVDTAIFETATVNFKPNALSAFAAQITDSSVGVFRDLYLSKAAGMGDVRLVFFESGGNSLIVDHTNPTSGNQTITLPGVTGTVLTTGNSDAPATTTSSGDADHVLIDDGGVMKKISPANLGVGGGGGGGTTAADDITAGDAAVNLTTTSGNITIDAQQGDADIIFKGTDDATDITALTLDMSEAGKAIFNGGVSLTSSDAGATAVAGTILSLDRNSASPAGGDVIGEVQYLGRNSAGETITYGSMGVKIEDASDGTEDSRLIYKVQNNGELKTVLDIKGNQFKVNNVSEVFFGDPVSALKFEGATGDAYELTLAITDPTGSDKTVTIPDATGTILTTGNSDTPTTTTSSSDADFVLIDDGGTMKKISPANLGIGGGGGGGSPAADDITTGDAAVTIATSSGNITIDAQANDSDIIFKGTDGGSDTTFLTLDGSDGGTATFNSGILTPYVQTGAVSSAYKFRYWSSATEFVSGFTFGYTYGGLGDGGGDGYAINWSNSNDNHRGFIWNDASHSQAQGAMALTTGGKLTVAHSIRVGYGESDTTTPGATHTLDVSGSFAATTKSFDIKHPTKEHMRLRYGVLEGPEHGVYVRGKLISSNVIELPEHWTGLVDEDTITVQLTPTGKFQKLYVKEISDNKITIGNGSFFSNNTECFYFVQGTRKDVDELEIEYEN